MTTTTYAHILTIGQMQQLGVGKLCQLLHEHYNELGEVLSDQARLRIEHYLRKKLSQWEERDNSYKDYDNAIKNLIKVTLTRKNNDTNIHA